jgi:hypothetical protein
MFSQDNFKQIKNNWGFNGRIYSHETTNSKISLSITIACRIKNQWEVLNEYRMCPFVPMFYGACQLKRVLFLCFEAYDITLYQFYEAYSKLKLFIRALQANTFRVGRAEPIEPVKNHRLGELYFL